MTTHAEKRGAASRAALLRSARRLFADLGFRGTSVGEIADSAGLRKPSLFHHFSSKQVLYRAVLSEIFSEMGQVVLTGAMASGTHLERLERMNNQLTDFLSTHPEAARLLFREAIEPSTAGGEEGIQLALQIMRGGCEFLRSGMDAGEFREQDPRQLLLSLLGLHLTYFAIGPLASPFLDVPEVTGSNATEERRTAVRAQILALVLPHDELLRRSRAEAPGVSEAPAARL